MSYFGKYVVILIAAVFMINGAMLSRVHAQTIESQIQKLREEKEKKEKALAKLVEQVAKENVSFDNPMDALNDVVAQVQLDENAKETVKNVNDIRESRYEMRRAAIFQSFILGTKYKFDKSSTQMDVDSKVSLMKTMPGESEGSGIYSEIMLKELAILANYIRAEVANIRREATISAAELRHLKKAGKIEKTFNMCQYYTERRKKKSFLDQVKGVASKAKDAYETGKNAVSQVSDGLAAIGELQDTAQSMIKEAQGMKPKDLTGGMF